MKVKNHKNFALLKQIKKYRNELVAELDTIAKDNIKFYRHKDDDEIYAIIDLQKNGYFLGYAHLGQHTEISKGYIAESKRVTLTNDQVKELKKELETIGYKF